MPNAYVILINGQSNSSAAGTISVGYPGWTAQNASPKIRFWCKDITQHLTYVPVYMPGFPCWGPEASYCFHRQAARPDDDLFVIKRVDGAYYHMAPGGPQWQPWLTDIITAIPLISAMGFTPIIDCLLLVGGEADAQEWPNRTSSLRYNMRAILDGLRTALDAPDMRMIVHRVYPVHDVSGLARPMQQTAGTWANCAWVDVDDVTKIDPGHADVAGTIEAGRRMWVADQPMITY
jgi:hypothetical protein